MGGVLIIQVVGCLTYQKKGGKGTEFSFEVGRLAQRREHPSYTQEVGGSNPLLPGIDKAVLM